MAPFIGEIRLFAGSFAPAGWAFCDGQILPISENDTLFNLIGTTYGGDGQETFALPDLRGRLPIHMGQGPGITQNYQISEIFGTEQVTLTTQQIPSHNHAFLVSTASGTGTNANGKAVAVPSDIRMYIRDTPATNFPANMLNPVGGSQPHENMSPALTISFIISLYGIFPSQT